MGAKPLRHPNAGRAEKIDGRARAQAEEMREAMQFQRGTPTRVHGFSRCSLNGVHSPWPLHFIAAPDEGPAPDCVDPAPTTVLVRELSRDTLGS